MKKVIEFLKKVLAFVTGLNFYGLGLLAIAVGMLVILQGAFWNRIALVMIGVFIGKNLQAIKEHLQGIRF